MCVFRCCCLLGCNVDLDVSENALVAHDLGLVLTDFLDLGNGDVLLVDLCTGCAESLCYLSCGDSAVELSALSDLRGKVDCDSGDLGCESLSVSDELGFLVCPLTESLLVLLDS